AYDPEMSYADNEANMLEAMEDVKTELGTLATRDTTVQEMMIEKDHYIGLNDDKIVVTHQDKQETLSQLINELMDEDIEIMTLFMGKDVSEEEEKVLRQTLTDEFEEKEIEYQRRDQPLYPYNLMIQYIYYFEMIHTFSSINLC